MLNWLISYENELFVQFICEGEGTDIFCGLAAALELKHAKIRGFDELGGAGARDTSGGALVADDIIFQELDSKWLACCGFVLCWK